MPKNLPAFFAGTLAEGAVIDLPEDERRHARRAGSVERRPAFDAEGNVAGNRVEPVARACAVAVGAVTLLALAAGGGVSPYVPAIRLPRLSWLVEKATELGAARVTIVASERAQRDRVESAARSGERLGRVVREAAKQSGQTFLPEVSGPIRFEEAARAATAHASAILLDASGSAFPPALEAPLVANAALRIRAVMHDAVGIHHVERLVGEGQVFGVGDAQVGNESGRCTSATGALD
jgi:16S rRNA U1498 N3-methylase RsmE